MIFLNGMRHVGRKIAPLSSKQKILKIFWIGCRGMPSFECLFMYSTNDYHDQRLYTTQMNDIVFFIQYLISLLDPN